MKRIAFFLIAATALVGLAVFMAPASGQTDKETVPIPITRLKQESL